VTVDRQFTAVVKAKVPFPEIPMAQRSARAAWCQAEKLELAGINWEIYMPWEGVDPAKLETDLYALLA